MGQERKLVLQIFPSQARDLNTDLERDELIEKLAASHDLLAHKGVPHRAQHRLRRAGDLYRGFHGCLSGAGGGGEGVGQGAGPLRLQHRWRADPSHEVADDVKSRHAGAGTQAAMWRETESPVFVLWSPIDSCSYLVPASFD